MKRKSNIQLLFLVFCLIASGVSTLFLTKASVQFQLTDTETRVPELYEEKSEASPQKALPDLELFRKLWEIGRQFMPAN